MYVPCNDAMPVSQPLINPDGAAIHACVIGGNCCGYNDGIIVDRYKFGIDSLSKLGYCIKSCSFVDLWVSRVMANALALSLYSYQVEQVCHSKQTSQKAIVGVRWEYLRLIRRNVFIGTIAVINPHTVPRLVICHALWVSSSRPQPWQSRIFLRNFTNASEVQTIVVFFW